MKTVMFAISRLLVSVRQNLPLRQVILLFAMIFVVSTLAQTTHANAEKRSLKLHFLHTGEKDEITFKRNGKYLPGGLKKINWFLRDWRAKEPTKMDPKLLDLIWEVYQETGSREYIKVISAYRSPKTNNLLRKRGRGVARKSQHSLGKALDFFIPGVKLSKLRAIGLRKGIGGVGYYPKSGSPFVHMDTGNVRHWPKMSRKELVRVFPKGRTLHIPSDGKPLPGYNIAKARHEKAKSGKIVIAKADDIASKPRVAARQLGRGNDVDTGVILAPVRPTNNVRTVAPAPAAAPAPAPVPTINAPAVAPVTEQPSFDEPSQALIASLVPSGQVPVPAVAPRPTIAQANTAQDLQPLAEETNGLEERQIALAVPVPVRADRAALLANPLTQIANASPAPAAPATAITPNTQVAALSPNEIADLRRQVYSTFDTPVPQPQPVQVAVAQPAPSISDRMSISAGPSLRIPRPAAGIPSANTNQNTNLIGYAETQTQIRTAINAYEQAQPSQTQTALQQQLNTQRLASQIQSTQQQNTVAPNNVLANIPVPVRNPQRFTAIQTASQQQVSNSATTTELNDAQIKSANLNERFVGKWALATGASISDIANIRRPAPSNNILSSPQRSVLSTGFTRDTINSFTQGFSNGGQPSGGLGTFE